MPRIKWQPRKRYKRVIWAQAQIDVRFPPVSSSNGYGVGTYGSGTYGGRL